MIMQDKVNKIIQSDCLEYLRELPDKSVNCFLIDEPYTILTGHKIEEGYNIDIAKQVRIEAMRILKDDGWFIFFNQFPGAWDFGRITMEAGFKPWQQCNEIVWCKRIVSSPFGKIGRIHENIFVFQKGSPQIYENKAPYEDIVVDNAFHGVVSFEAVKRAISGFKSQAINGYKEYRTVYRDRSNANDNIYKISSKNRDFVCQRFPDNSRLPSVWSFVVENKIHRNKHNIKHPTVKPVLLYNRLVRLFTQEQEIIVDCFAGSGTTALASKQTNRNFLCCERDEEYVKIANERIANWQEDLKRQEKWLNDRGVIDFFENKTQQNENMNLFDDDNIHQQ